MTSIYKISLLVLLLASCSVWGSPCPPAGCTAPPAPARHRRDVMENMKQAWNDMTAAVKSTGDRILYTFQPTTSRIDGLLDTINQSG